MVGTDDPEVAKLDGGAFLEWLQRQDEETGQSSSSANNAAFQPRVAVIGHNFKPIPANIEAPELNSLAKPLAAARQHAINAIATPSYVNIQEVSAQGTTSLLRGVRKRHNIHVVSGQTDKFRDSFLLLDILLLRPYSN